MRLCSSDLLLIHYVLYPPICLFSDLSLTEGFSKKKCENATFCKGVCFLLQIESSVPARVLECVLQELKGLQEFLDRNSQFTTVGALGNPRYY